MPNKQQQNKFVAKSNDGREMNLQETCTEIDTPVLPPPEILERIQNCRPDIIDWMLKETSQEAANRRSLESKRMDAACNALKRGQWFGLFTGLAGICGGAFVAIFSSSPTAGATIASFAITVLAVAFVTNKKSKE